VATQGVNERRDRVRDPIRGTHLGQRSYPTAQTSRTYDRKSPLPYRFPSCRPGAVNIWVAGPNPAKAVVSRREKYLGSFAKPQPDSREA